MASRFGQNTHRCMQFSDNNNKMSHGSKLDNSVSGVTQSRKTASLTEVRSGQDTAAQEPSLQEFPIAPVRLTLTDAAWRSSRPSLSYVGLTAIWLQHG